MTTLRRVGLSENKALYIRDLARHFVSGILDPREWRDLGDEDLIDRLTGVKGIGRWTAEMFLMFHELRPDVLPVADIGLQNAVALHYHGGTRVPVAELREFATDVVAVAQRRHVVSVAFAGPDSRRLLA